MGDNGHSDDRRGGEPERNLSDTGESLDSPLTPSVVFGILADKRHRFVLYLLEARGGTVALDELATEIAAWENDTRPELITKEMESRVHNRLFHAGIPKLAEYGLVTHTKDSEAVTLTQLGEQLEAYLEFAKEREQQDVDDFIERSKRDPE